MKTDNKIWLALASGLLLVGCADQDIDIYNVEKPESIAQYEYLNEYGNLKDYISKRSGANPNFKLGSGVLANDYNKFGLVYRVTNANFNIITAGNAMKYASVVGDDGSMNFSTVQEFLRAAEEAGTEVYGHTFCWHEQQNVKWLNSLIADRELEIDPDAKNEVEDAYKDFKNDARFPYFVMGYEPEIIDGILTVPEYPGDWYQFFVMDGLTTVPGRAYTITAKIRGSEPGQLNVQFGNWGALEEKALTFTDEWEERSITYDNGVTTEGSFVVFQPGTYPGKLEIEWLKLSHSEAPAIEIAYDILGGSGDAEDGECENLIAREFGNADIPARVVDDPLGTGKVFECTYNANPSQAWDSQFFIRSKDALPAGTKVHVKFRYRTTDDRNIDTQAHGEPGAYHHWAFIGTLNATPEWKWHEWSGEISGDHAGADGCHSIAFNLSSAESAGKFFIDDVVFEKIEKGNKIPMTAEEKADTLTSEMGRWIKGMMNATEGKVKCWDVVNEAISGRQKGDRYDLQHAEYDPDAENKFYWQDYLGDNFVRVPVKFARQYFEENGGNPADLKLFVNDYNLESDWDDNQKLKSLIKWIEQWESDGVTKIDGIGTQMHISYYMNKDIQKSKEDHIVKMFELMAATGKLVRITELDMGIVGEDGQDIATEDVTLEQQKLMSDYYKFIINKYFEIIPAPQQHGITIWCQTDSPKDSGWRANQPVGIWDSNFNRKPVYAGIAEGLEGR